MKAINEAKTMFALKGFNFEQHLAWYLQSGIVISRDDRFLMAKKINHARGDDEWNPEDADAWYVHCAVGKGSLEWFLLQAPVRLPYLCWRRIKQGENRLKCYRTETFERLVT